jgi:hypothetical protein
MTSSCCLGDAEQLSGPTMHTLVKLRKLNGVLARSDLKKPSGIKSLVTITLDWYQFLFRILGLKQAQTSDFSSRFTGPWTQVFTECGLTS